MAHPRIRLAVQGLTTLVAVVVVGLILYKRFWIQTFIHEPLQRRAAAITAELKAKGAHVGDPQIVQGTPGIEQMISLDIEGRSIRLLEFDSATDAEAKELRQIHDNHTTSVLGTAQPAEDYEQIVIIDFESHPRKDQILEAFHKPAEGR